MIFIPLEISLSIVFLSGVKEAYIMEISNGMNLVVVMFNMSSYVEWEKQGIVNRNYHIFHKLLNSEHVKRVIAVDFLPFSFKRALRNYIENIIFALMCPEDLLEASAPFLLFVFMASIIPINSHTFIDIPGT